MSMICFGRRQTITDMLDNARKEGHPPERRVWWKASVSAEAVMRWMGDVNLIRCLDWYLLVIFVASTILRLHQYRALLGLVWLFPGRWPSLLELITKHHSIF